MVVPDVSIRPMGLPVAMIVLTVAGLIVFLPVALLCSWLAEKAGSPKGSAIAKTSSVAAAAPFLIGLVGLIVLFIICNLRGIRIGD